MPPPTIEVLLIGSGPLAARAVAEMRLYPDLSISHVTRPEASGVGDEADGGPAPHVILMETQCLDSPARGGLPLLARIAPVVLLGSDPEERLVLEGLRLGARGHVDWPSEEPDRLAVAVRIAASGYPALSPRATARLVSHLAGERPGHLRRATPPPVQPPLPGLLGWRIDVAAPAAAELGEASLEQGPSHPPWSPAWHGAVADGSAGHHHDTTSERSVT